MSTLNVALTAIGLSLLFFGGFALGHTSGRTAAEKRTDNIRTAILDGVVKGLASDLVECETMRIMEKRMAAGPPVSLKLAPDGQFADPQP